MIKTIIAQMFGIGAMLALFSVYQQNDRKKLLISKLTADFCWAVHYLCLGAYGGMIPNLSGIFREMVFVNRESKKWANHIVWLIIFILINWLLGIRTFQSAINILPIAASTFVTIAFWSKNPKITKIISIPVSAVFLIYDLFVGSYIGVINESIGILSFILYIIKSILRRKNVCVRKRK